MFFMNYMILHSLFSDGVVVVMGMKKHSATTVLPNGNLNDLRVDTTTQAQIHREMTSSKTASEVTPSRPTLMSTSIAPPEVLSNTNEAPDMPALVAQKTTKEATKGDQIDKAEINEKSTTKKTEAQDTKIVKEEESCGKVESFQLHQHLGRGSNQATPTQRSR
jgi:hypothetical protein